VATVARILHFLYMPLPVAVLGLNYKNKNKIGLLLYREEWQGSFRGERVRTTFPLLNVLKNALWTALRFVFRPQMR